MKRGSIRRRPRINGYDPIIGRDPISQSSDLYISVLDGRDRVNRAARPRNHRPCKLVIAAIVQETQNASGQWRTISTGSMPFSTTASVGDHATLTVGHSWQVPCTRNPRYSGAVPARIRFTFELFELPNTSKGFFDGIVLW